MVNYLFFLEFCYSIVSIFLVPCSTSKIELGIIVVKINQREETWKITMESKEKEKMEKGKKGNH